MMICRLLLPLSLLLGAPAAADDEDREGFVEANLAWTFYHEAAHALIDRLSLPVLGREEDAADVLAVLLIDEIWDPEAAAELARYQALGWLAASAASGAEEIAFWDVHGSDQQRFYSHVCLWYGADPEARRDFAEEFQLPEARAVGCADEFQLAHRSWFDLLEPLQKQAPGSGLIFQAGAGDFADDLVAEEVRTLNSLFAIPGETLVSVETCGEVNAFYLPSESRIVICQDYVDYLWHQAEDLDL